MKKPSSNTVGRTCTTGRPDHFFWKLELQLIALKPPNPRRARPEPPSSLRDFVERDEACFRGQCPDSRTVVVSGVHKWHTEIP